MQLNTLHRQEPFDSALTAKKSMGAPQVFILYSRIGISLPDDEFIHHLKKLPARLHNEILKFHKRNDAQASLLGKLLLGTGLSRHYNLPANILNEIEFSYYKRPFLPGLDIDFNISHSGEYVICSLIKGARTGIDVEYIRDISPGDFTSEFNRRGFSLINESSDVTRAFFSSWTKKEAVVKGEGSGLHINLNQVELNGKRAKLFSKIWYLEEVPLDKNHCCWFAIDQKIESSCITVEFAPFS